MLTGIGPTNALVVSRLRSNSKTARAPQFGKLYWGALMHKHREAETRAALAAEQRAAWGALGRSAALSEALAARVPVAQVCARFNRLFVRPRSVFAGSQRAFVGVGGQLTGADWPSPHCPSRRGHGGCRLSAGGALRSVGPDPRR